MNQFRNPQVQKAYELYEVGEITKAEYLQELRKINLDPKYKYISQFYHGNKQIKRANHDDLFN